MEAESLLWQGKYAEVLALINSEPTRPNHQDSLVELFAVEATAYTYLHNVLEADKKLTQATKTCEISPVSACGGVARAQGILADQQGHTDAAKRFFLESLQFARVRNDPFLEETNLLNLGTVALDEGHFDEAIDWTDAAYQKAMSLGADGEAQAALGNLGWAYYNLGDSERSLDLSISAEKAAIRVGGIIDQLYWITNAGYVYADRGDLARAKESYLRALDLATEIGGRQGIYNADRALALVSVESGDLNNARKYSADALAIARTDQNRLDELYPLLVNGLIAARLKDSAEAERIFREVENDPAANASLMWRSEHALARLYEDEGRPDAADREYRAALTTFERARSSLQRNDSKLPFSNNAARIYDDYIHFLIAQKRSDDALRWADYSRARTLAEGLGYLPKDGSAEPPPLNPREIARRAQGSVLFYWLGQKESYLWAITAQKTSLFVLPAGADIEVAAQRYFKVLREPGDVLQSADADGRWLYRALISPAQALLKKDARVFVIPDGGLNNLNFETLLVEASNHADATSSPSKLHYWIEDATIANASSLRLLASARESTASKGKGWNRNSETRERRLLLIGNSIAPNDEYPALPKAAAQMESIARHFPQARLRQIAREEATPGAYLESNPGQFFYIDFVAHGTASRLSPLDSAIVLSRTAAPNAGNSTDDSFKLYAREIIQHPLHAELVTISACYGAGRRAYSGEGLVGLSWAFLRAGAHNVVAALWDVQDASTEQLMDRFYDGLNQEAGPDVALRDAKLSLLRSNAFHNPYYWAPFQLYTGS